MGSAQRGPLQPATRLLVPWKLLKPDRYGDHGADLWTTFNVLQKCRA
jgi:hypothetical protein